MTTTTALCNISTPMTYVAKSYPWDNSVLLFKRLSDPKHYAWLRT